MRLNTKSALRGLRQVRVDIPRAAARAINKSTTSVRATAAREINADMGLRVSDVRDELRVTRATTQNPVAEIRVSGRRIPLVRFHARGPEPSRGKGRGVSYRIGKQGRGRVPSGFIATMKSGHRGVFKRTATRRLPIIELFGPSIVRVFSKATIVKAMQDRYEEAMLKNLPHEIEFELRRIGGSS